jgi:lysozyme family protein
MRALGIDLTRDGKVDEADVRALTEADAIRIYVEHYFKRTGIGLLPEPLRPSVFDMQVNSGTYAGRILQSLLGEFGVPLTVDGCIGPRTARAAEACWKMAPDHLVDAYGIGRRNYYYRLADLRPACRKYACRRDGGKGGWITRAEEFMSPRYHFTHEQHQERIAAWG